MAVDEAETAGQTNTGPLSCHPVFFFCVGGGEGSECLFFFMKGADDMSLKVFFLSLLLCTLSSFCSLSCAGGRCVRASFGSFLLLVFPLLVRVRPTKTTAGYINMRLACGPE